MKLLTEDLVLRTVGNDDLNEIARMWNFMQGGASAEEARRALAYMSANHMRNAKGQFYHLCLAVCRQECPERIEGWCGLDGKLRPECPEIYVLLHESIRGRGYGTQCAKALLAYAFDVVGLGSVHGGCDKQNVASAMMMSKAGMRYYGDAENGDPLFIIHADSR